MLYDAIVVGGSYAGMAAALQLLRARRKVLIVDAGQRRNRFAAHSHGFLGQDGIDPAVIARQAREQLEAYPTLRWIDGMAVDARTNDDGVSVTLADGEAFTGKRLLLALGVSDTLPDVPGLQERWGMHVFHCPYCHGYELGGGPVGILATGPMSMHQALMLPEWGATTFFLNGAFAPDADQRAALAARNVTVEEAPVAGIHGAADVELEDGRVIELAGIFTATRTRPSSPLADKLGCELDEGMLGPVVRVDGMKRTSVPNVFACGDVASSMHSVSLAVSDGAMAGAGIHRSLMFPE